MKNGFQKTASGTASAVDGAVDATVIAAQGADTIIRVQKAVISVFVAGADSGGQVALEDGVGGTRFFVADADAVGVFSVDFGDEGFPLTANTLLNVTVDGDGTTEASARVTAVGKVA